MLRQSEADKLPALISHEPVAKEVRAYILL